MNFAMPKSQRGLSFSGFIFGAFVFVLLSITGLKLIPAYMQFGAINNIFTAIANDPEMQKASLRDVRASFGKRSVIDNITAIKADDIDLEVNSGRLIITASYAVKVPLAGNVSLYLDFNASSAH